MLLDSIVTSVVKKSINTLIEKNSESQRILLRLKNKKLKVFFSDINKQLIFIFDNDVDVQSIFDEKIDCSLFLALSIAPKLKDKSQLASLIKQDKLQLEGDIDVLQQFSALLETLDFDIAEWLSQYTGDVIAHSLVTSTQSAFSGLKNFAKRQERYLGEVIVEEWKLSPNALEIAYFADCVDELEKKAKKIEQRLQDLDEYITKAKL